MNWQLSMETDFIYTDESVLNEKASSAAIIDNHSSIERPPNKSSIFRKLLGLYLILLIGMSYDEEMNFIIYCKSLEYGMNIT